MQSTKFLLGLLLVFTTYSCSLFQKEKEGTPVARINDTYLYKENLETELQEQAAILDSSSAATIVINEWATRTLLLDGAARNLSEEQQQRFEDLVKKYKEDLLIKAYRDVLVAQRLDTIINDDEAVIFYEQNKENFKLNEDLVQFRYIQVLEDYKNLKSVTKGLRNFDSEDRMELDSLSFQFQQSYLNDSVWVKKTDIIRNIDPITLDNADRLLKKADFLQLRDSLGLYLVAIKNTLSRNEIAPLSYVRPTINQIILNKRKLELVKKIEKEIKDDAIKNDKFEIFN